MIETNKKRQIFFLLSTLSIFIYLFLNVFFVRLDGTFLLNLRLYDIMMLSVSMLFLLNKKLFNSMVQDIIDGQKDVSLAAAVVSSIYSLIALSIATVVVKEEILYFFHIISNLSLFSFFKGFNFVADINYFDFYDKLFWDKLLFVNNLSVVGSFIKIWIVGIFLSFNPFYMKDRFWVADIKITGFKVLLLIAIMISLYESLTVNTIDLMKANYYFFKQSLIFLMFYALLFNIKDFQDDKSFLKVYHNAELILIYTIMISIQTLFYRYLYNIYFLEVILILVAISCRDRFTIKVDKYFFVMLSLLVIYEMVFFILNKSSINDNFLEKITAMCISTFLFFYKDLIIDKYRKKKPVPDEKEFIFENLKRRFNKKFGHIFNSEQIQFIEYDKKSYLVNGEIKFDLFYPLNIENPFMFNYEITYPLDLKHKELFLEKYQAQFVFDCNEFKYLQKKHNKKMKKK